MHAVAKPMEAKLMIGCHGVEAHLLEPLRALDATNPFGADHLRVTESKAEGKS